MKYQSTILEKYFEIRGVKLKLDLISRRLCESIAKNTDMNAVIEDMAVAMREERSLRIKLINLKVDMAQLIEKTQVPLHN